MWSPDLLSLAEALAEIVDDVSRGRSIYLTLSPFKQTLAVDQ